MKKNIIKYSLLAIVLFILPILYLSIVGIETKKFNKQIVDKINQTNDKLDLKLKKVKLTLDILNFKINAKTIGAKIVYQNKVLELEYIKTQISLNSLIKNKFVSSNLEISTKSILLKDLVRFAKATINRPELFFLERMIKKGYAIVDLKINFDENGKIKDNYQIKGILKDGKINFYKNLNFENINFILNAKDNVINFNDIAFKTNEMNFFSDNLRVTQKKKDFIFEGSIENKNTNINKNLRDIIKLNFENINFDSKNNFSFMIDNKFGLKDLVIESEINIHETKYKKSDFINEYFPKAKNLIYFKDHKIKATYKKNDYSLTGIGKIKLQKEFDEIKYLINSKNKDFNLILKIALSELTLNNQEFLKKFFPVANKEIILKNNQVEINYNKNDLLIKGLGKIKLEKKFDQIDYYISKIGNKFNFDVKLDLNGTLLKIDYLNFKKDKELDTKLEILGSYEKDKQINLKKVSIQNKNNQINLSNLLLDGQRKILEIDKIDLDYIDIENKKNQFLLQRTQQNKYELNGKVFNANSLITNLFKSKNDQHTKIFKNDISLNLNLAEVYIDEESMVKNLKGNLVIKNNKVVRTDISAFFSNNEKLTFTINTSNDEKITTLFSSRAKPIVERYKFIKGYEEGYLDFYSSKKDNISQSILKIYDFKLQELPTLTKILTLASLQGIADILSGEGIRFDEFEMKFNNKGNLMTINEIHAIGPAISILMDGYVEQDRLVSLRGTLVPATTINNIISNIPFLGKILVGDKTGEGVFGVSFKIKGSPKDLETTVNPIKTLTPRFITRTIEKIKKN